MYTCHNSLGASCVDYAIVSDSLVQSVQSFEIGELQPYSDHCPIVLTLCTGPGTATVETHKYYSQLLFTKELLKDLSKRSPPCTPATNHTQSNTKSFVKWYPTNTRLFLDALHNTPPTLLLSNTPIDDIVCNYTQQLMKLATDSEYAKLIAISKDNNKKFHQKHTNNLIAWFDDDCKKMKKEVKIKLAAWRRNPGNQSLRKDYYDYTELHGKG